jgi:hypothetical protein
MEDKFKVPVANKYIIRSTGEEVEVIAFNLPNQGMRTEANENIYDQGDWVTYIDSEGKEHIRETLNIQLDFKAQVSDVLDKMLDVAKVNKYPTERNRRVFDTAQKLILSKAMSIEDAVDTAIELVDKVGVEFNVE